MAAFLLWNTRGKELDSLVQGLVQQYRIDVVLLVEYAFGSSQLSRLLLGQGLIKRPSQKRFGVFAREDHELRRFHHPLGDRAGVWKWVPPSGMEGVFALLHGIRPDESPRFPESELRIVTSVGGISLLDPDGLPDRETASDHLPVVFHWNL